MTTECGYIVLYAGNQISIFYETNLWSYTMLGKIKDKTKAKIKSILGSGTIEITISLNLEGTK